MTAMTLREELIEKIARLPEAQLRAIAPIIDKAAQEAQSPSSFDWLEDARAFREQMNAKYGLMPDSAETLRRMREERPDDIMGLR